MAIWRGTGGSGESTSDSTINITTTLANQAAASATAAAASETAAEAAQAAAQTAETNAETAETNAETAATNAQTAETNAETAATNAASSATAAADSATAAAASAASINPALFLTKAGNLSDLTNTSTARTNLGVAIGTNVQAYDAQLTDIAGLTPTDNGVVIGNGTNFVVESGATLKTSLGLTIGTDVQAYDADLAAIAASGKGDQLVSYGIYGVGFKNRIINGRMEISQRTAATSVNTSGTGYVYQLDRFYCGGLSGVTTPFTIQQVADAPTGFVNSAKVTVNTTDALSTATTEYGFQHNIEANNTTDFNLGSANATAVTLSFWVKSSLTGTFSVSIRNAPTFNRTYVATYTINSANTWEQKTVTLTMDTTGTWNTYGTSASMNITWSLGCGSNYRTTAGSWGAGAQVQTSGSVNLVSNAAATWQITGVQLERGSTATSFDTRPYTTELQLCQRYYEKSFSTSTVPAQAAGLAGAITSEQFASGHNYLRFPVVMYAVEKRGLPTITFYNPNTASTTPAGLRAGREDGNTSYNNSVGERSNFRSTRDFFPLLDGTNQGGNGAFDVWCTQWTADAEI